MCPAHSNHSATSSLAPSSIGYSDIHRFKPSLHLFRSSGLFRYVLLFSCLCLTVVSLVRADILAPSHRLSGLSAITDVPSVYNYSTVSCRPCDYLGERRA